MICDYRPLKKEQYRVRLTVGGDKLEYANDSASPTASLLYSKLLFNNVISDCSKCAKFMSIDLKDHFHQTIMADPNKLNPNIWSHVTRKAKLILCVDDFGVK